MNLRVTKTILKEKFYFKVTLNHGSHKCEVRQFVHDKVIKGTISEDGKEINLSEPFKFNDRGKDKIKEVTNLKVPTDRLISVLDFIHAA